MLCGALSCLAWSKHESHGMMRNFAYTTMMQKFLSVSSHTVAMAHSNDPYHGLCTVPSATCSMVVTGSRAVVHVPIVDSVLKPSAPSQARPIHTARAHVSTQEVPSSELNTEDSSHCGKVCQKHADVALLQVLHNATPSLLHNALSLSATCQPSEGFHELLRAT